LLQYLRVVLIQDAVLLKEKYPNLYIYHHTIFQNPSFINYSNDLKKAMCEKEHPRESQPRTAMPLLSEKIDTIAFKTFSAQKEILGKLDKFYEDFNLEKRKLNDILDGKASITLKMEQSNYDNHNNTSNPNKCDQPANNVENLINMQTEQNPLLENGPPYYKMCRALETVSEVWREYSEGFGGNVSVENLENSYGTRWRKDENERRFFNRRNVIYQEIKKISRERGVSCGEAAVFLEQKRNIMGLSVNGLQKKIGRGA
jgi:hypothetical protein